MLDTSVVPRRSASTAKQLPSPSRGQLATSAYDQLRGQIIRCEIAPGDRFTEASLVSRLELGKTPIREALTRLTQDGLVRSIPGHGYEVTPITLQDIEDLYSLRLIVEPTAVEQAAGRVDQVGLRQLDSMCAAAYSMEDPASLVEFLRINTQFHQMIVAASGNRRLGEVVHKILDESERLMHLGLALRDRNAEVAHEHRDLVEALARGDGPAARQIAEQQIRGSREVVLDALLRSPALLRASLSG